MAKQKNNAVRASSGTVFADLGLANAKDLETKVRLAASRNAILARRRLTQAEAARVMGENQPEVSALKGYKLEGFSVERLMHFATALGQYVVIEIRPRVDEGSGVGDGGWGDLRMGERSRFAQFPHPGIDYREGALSTGVTWNSLGLAAEYSKSVDLWSSEWSDELHGRRAQATGFAGVWSTNKARSRARVAFSRRLGAGVRVRPNLHRRS